MYDPTKAGWFLQYTDGNGNKNGTVYNEPGGPGDQFFWDYREEVVTDYYITSIMSTLTDPAVDGTFTGACHCWWGGGGRGLRRQASKHV